MKTTHPLWLLLIVAVLASSLLTASLFPPGSGSAVYAQGRPTPTPTFRSPPPAEEEGEEEWPPPTPTPLPCGECIRQKIGPEGGEIDLPANRILVTVPPGCLTQEIEFTLCIPCTCECGPVEKTVFWLGDVCLTLEGWFAGGQKTPHDYLFACPIVITIGYTDANLAEVGGEPRGLGLARCDETTGGWVPLNPILDEKNRNVSALVDHLSWFALTHSLPVTEPPPAMPETGEEIPDWGWPSALPSVALVLILVAFGYTAILMARLRKPG